MADSFASAVFSDATIIYEEGTGLLIYNENGSRLGFGRGGVFAQLDSGLDLSAENFDVV